MHIQQGMIADIPATVFRVSFTGELSFEINVPARFGLRLWEYLMALGEPWNICPIGSEANHVLRVEKGFLSLAHEVDGTVDPVDLGMNWIVSRKKIDFVGQRAMQIRRKNQVRRQELVGLLHRIGMCRLPRARRLRQAEGNHTRRDLFQPVSGVM